MEFEWRKISLEKALKLPMRDDGTRVVTKVNLETDYPTRGRRTTTINVRSSIRAIKSKLVIEVDFPFITVTTEEKLNECIMKNANPDTGFFLNPEDNLYYLVPIEVMQDYFDIRDVCEPSEIEDGYDEETELYYRDGIAYEEGDVVFVGIDEIDRDIPPEKWEPWIANSDTLENDILSFFDIKILKKIDYFKDKETKDLLPCDIAWLTILEKTAEQKKPGIAFVFLNKQIMVPVESFVNEATQEEEQFLVVFNAYECNPLHHNCKWYLSGDIGNMPVDIYARYRPGVFIDWEAIIGRRIEAEKKSEADFSPYSDPDGGGPKIVLL